MKRGLILIVAGVLGGFLGSIMEIMFSFRGVILGGFLSLGIVIIEALSNNDSLKNYSSSKTKILTVSVITGVFSGIFTSFSVMRGPYEDLLIYVLPGSFSFVELVCLIALYPLLILPAYFPGQRYFMVIVSGTTASFIIEGYRSMVETRSFDLMFTAISSTRGLAYSAMWIGCIYLVSRPFKFLGGKSFLDFDYSQVIAN